MKNILFVCVENSCRSQIAEAFANIHGNKQINSYSSGSKASGVINPKAIKSMADIGYDLTRHHSKSLDEIPDLEYDYAITMGCGDECPFVKANNRLDWAIADPKNMSEVEFNGIRDIIEQKVLVLLDTLSKN